VESIFEKITLYDILGYLFPGSVFTAMLMFGGRKDYVLELTVRWRDSMAVLYMAFIVVSYLAGVMLSEICEWLKLLYRGLFLVFKKTKCAALGNMKPIKWLVEKGRQLLGNDFEQFEGQMVKALIRSGMEEDETAIKANLRNGKDGYYKKYIYGNIQGRGDYKRIHSYASAYVMYRNTAAALLIGLAVLWVKYGVCGPASVWMPLLGIVLAVRSFRFWKKKNQYALFWFMEKYGEDR